MSIYWPSSLFFFLNYKHVAALMLKKSNIFVFMFFFENLSNSCKWEQSISD